MPSETHKVGEITIIALSERVVRGSLGPMLRDPFRTALEARERRFVIDFREASYLDSAGVGETVACLKRAGEVGGTVKLVATPSSKPDQILRLTAMDRVFELFGEMEDALASFAARDR